MMTGNALMSSGLLFIMAGCLAMNDCRDSTNCFYQKLDNCEAGAKLRAASSYRPEYAEIMGKEGDGCVIKFRTRSLDPSTAFQMSSEGWGEEDLVDCECVLMNHEEIMTDNKMASALWIMINMMPRAGSEEGCSRLADGLSSGRNKNFGER